MNKEEPREPKELTIDDCQDCYAVVDVIGCTNKEVIGLYGRNNFRELLKHKTYHEALDCAQRFVESQGRVVKVISKGAYDTLKNRSEECLGLRERLAVALATNDLMERSYTKLAEENAQRRSIEECVAILQNLGQEPDYAIKIIFDGPPGNDSGRFVEVENEHGVSLACGDWFEDGEFWALRISISDILESNK